MPTPILPDLSQYPVIACDGETTGLNWWSDELFGLAFAWLDRGVVQSLYVDVREGNNLQWARDQLRRARKIVNHNIKFDMHFWREAGILVDPAVCECTMVREALIDEHRKSHSLDAIAKDRLGVGKTDIWPRLADLFGGKPTKEEQIPRLSLAPADLVAEYARPDAELALRIWFKQETDLDSQSLRPICALEHELLAVIIDMEHRGVRVDLEAAGRASKVLTQGMAEDQRELNRLAGFVVNVNSGPQVVRIVRPQKDDTGTWRARDGTLLEETEGGAPSIRTHALHNMRFREAELIASIRGMTKARDVFIDKYVLGMNYRGYVHANINQTKTDSDSGTTTGRLSITNPALQQIHKRDKKMAAVVRSMFLPDPGQQWGSFDWSQMDFRMFAHYVREPSLFEAYDADPRADFHDIVSELVGVPRNRDEKTGGANAKQINLAMVFGMGQGKLAREMGLPYTVDPRGNLRAGDEAQVVFDRYHATIPGVKQLQHTAESVAKKRGYILTPLGRRLHFPDPNKAYKAAGLLFQGAAADALKIKMVEMGKMTAGTGSRLMLTVHDEFNLSMGGDVTADAVVELLQRFDGVKTPMSFRVPVVSMGGIAGNWWDASK